MKNLVPDLHLLKMSNTRTFKVLLVGSGGCGKSALVKALKTGEFLGRYTPTMGVAVSPVKVRTSHGKIVFDCWDCAGQAKFRGDVRHYYNNVDAAIVMFDLTNSATLDEALNLREELRATINNDFPIILVGNKSDSEWRVVSHEQILACESFSENITISVKTRVNFEAPFLSLARHILGYHELTLGDEILFEG